MHKLRKRIYAFKINYYLFYSKQVSTGFDFHKNYLSKGELKEIQVVRQNNKTTSTKGHTFYSSSVRHIMIKKIKDYITSILQAVFLCRMMFMSYCGTLL